MPQLVISLSPFGRDNEGSPRSRGAILTLSCALAASRAIAAYLTVGGGAMVSGLAAPQI